MAAPAILTEIRIHRKTFPMPQKLFKHRENTASQELYLVKCNFFFNLIGT